MPLESEVLTLDKLDSSFSPRLGDHVRVWVGSEVFTKRELVTALAYQEADGGLILVETHHMGYRREWLLKTTSPDDEVKDAAGT